MKTAGRRGNIEDKQLTSHMTKPEIRDNLDSRKKAEQIFKGDDTTHNRKDKHSKGKKS